VTPTTQPEFSENVVRFIADYIDSVPQLEALLLLWDTAPRAWTLEELAARIYVSPQATQDIATALERRQLIRRDERGAYALNGEGVDGARMAEVAGTYRRKLAQVAGLIHSKASLGVLEFARAFRLKKES
jgi:Mn-dependent DtxR family transcriptional regulator